MKGRDWYDLIWYASKHPEVRLSHLEARMRQSGNYCEERPLSAEKLRRLLREAVDTLNVAKSRQEVSPFVRDHRALDVWSREFFADVVQRVIPI